MKWFIYSLVVVNLAFFVWQYRRPTTPMTVPAVAELASTPRLLLRREADESSLLPRGAPPRRDSSAATRSVGDVGPPSTGPSRQSSQPRPGARTGADQTCFAMGPFGADESVVDLLIWLKGNGAEATSRWSEQDTPSRYWVYLPPLETVEQARAVLRRLKDDGLQDYVRVMRGPMRNAISLGLFRQRDSADRRLTELRGKGYDPELDIRYKSERVHWVDVVFSRGVRFSEAAFRTEFPAVNWSPAHCPAAGSIAGVPAVP